MIKPFSFSPFPKIHFGKGAADDLASKLPSSTKNVLLIIGGSSLEKSGSLKRIQNDLTAAKIDSFTYSITSEPSPENIDAATAEFRDSAIDYVIAIGGGSVLDAGKAIAAMLKIDDSITHYLEGVGDKTHPGITIPFAAIPTTAGTGSEATKNAVITSLGENGFKKSLRHDNFIPDMAIIDPLMMQSCPKDITAACGLDALTQLFESYVSTNSNPISDALAFDALQRVLRSLPDAIENGLEDIDARADLAYGAFISGVCLANAGLGIVHGFASPIGGFFDIPHGVVCGTLLPAATEKNIERLQESHAIEHKELLTKHVKVARVLFPDSSPSDSLKLFVDYLYQMTENFDIPKLSHYGILEKDFEKIIEKTGLKNNPIELSQSDLKEILKKRL
ncbi:MAG: iron-containing alcohol dehydrogenase [Lentisphaeraceae bacterium]|nr:iron-containing alcohol dehydrogenase [Lentisphaeraceae bacterium]